MSFRHQLQGEIKATASERRWQAIGRVLLPLFSLMFMLQPMAYGAPTPSLLSQSPMFLNARVDSNAMFLMDDSLSMDDIRLPVPTGLNPGESLGGNVTVNAQIPNGAGGVTTSAVSVERVNEWILRSSALNPVYYNPAITYTPWNDNGRAGTSGNFGASSTAIVTDQSNGFRQGLVAQDMRYAGPNYTSSNGSNLTRFSTVTGANPPGVPSYLAANRPANGGFTGTVDANRNQDIFSSPLVFVSGTPSCSGTLVNANVSSQPSTPQTSSPQPYTVRTSSSQTSTAQPYSPRATSLPTSTPQTYTTDAYTLRTTTAQTFSTRTITAQSFTARTITNVTSSAQSYTVRTSSPQTTTTRGTQYRTEVVPTCDKTTFTTWTTMSSPPASPGLCPDPTTELGTRPAIVQSQPAPCASGTTASADGLSCVTNCASGFTSNGAGQCVSNCGSGTTAATVGGQSVCLSSCPSGTTSNGSTTSPMCVGTCASGTTAYGTNQCISNCASGTTAGTSGGTQVCYAACASGTTSYGTNQCISNCASGTTAGTSGGQQVCFNACPTGTTASGGQCLSNCAAGTTGGTVGGQPACLTNCPTGTSTGTVGGVPVCLTNCTGGATAGTSGGLPVCIACAAGTTNIGGTCYANCGTGTSSGTVNGVRVCLTNCAAGTSANGSSTNPQCVGGCASGSTLISGTCYANCATGTTAGTSGSQQVCYSACPSGTTLSGTSCVAACPTGTTQSGSNCLSACPTGATLTAGQCYSCPSGTTSFGSSNQCCPTGGTTLSGCPVGMTCSVSNMYYADSTQPALAHYFVFQPVSTTRAPTTAELSNPANYLRIQINRDFQQTYNKPYKSNNPLLGVADRLDCGTGATCTWAQEAQNFANWYSYYRTRLFSAMAVTGESLSGLTHARGLDTLRLGYGSINYFPGGYNPYTGGSLPATMTVDGQSSVGAIVRGVRPFTEVNPPPAPGSNDRRQEMFDWLFSLRATSQTPNREALDSAGRYFARDDRTGPWIMPDTATTWSTTADKSTDYACRRNFSILVTDGEWTRGLFTSVQPLMEDSARPAVPANLSSQAAGTPLNALTTVGPSLTGQGAAASLGTWQYTPTGQPQFSTNAGSTTGTLSDVALYYWSRDLRPDLPNAIVPSVGSADVAFWQHMTPYIVGYGISASLNSSTTRSAIANGTAVSWPTVVMENRPSEQGTIITDHDVYLPPPGADRCRYDATSNPAGCGREDDTFRAAMAARGDFLTATDIPALAQSVALAFNAAGAVTGSGTAIAGKSAALQAGQDIYVASFKTIEWTGDLSAYDATQWFTSAGNAQAAPAAIWHSNFPSSRDILTWSETGGAGAGGATTFQYANVSPAQQALLGGSTNGPPTVAYLRGDQSGELSNGGKFRNRSTVLGDIVNSSPLYSQAPDYFYAGRAPSAGGTAAGSAYSSYLTAHQNVSSGRRAALYFGANDGMFHAFAADTGSELFSYVPRSVYTQLPDLTSPYYIHHYYVDGPVTEGDVYFNGAWHTTMVGTTGLGATSVFAIDTTDPTSVGTGNVLWDKVAADSSDLGHILGTGVIGSAKDGQWYYFAGNGYESANDKATLLMINMSSGAITSIATDGAGGSNPAATTRSGRPNGLGAITPVYDPNRNVVAVYAGDQLGRLWKFDLSGSSAGNLTATVTLMFDTASNTVTGAGAQPITAAPRITAHPLGGRYIVFGTGSFFDTTDQADSSVQSVYALWEQNPSTPVTIAKNRLAQFSLTQTTDPTTGQIFRGLDGLTGLNFVGANPNLGWYFNLIVGNSSTGERVIQTPIENLGFVNVVSYAPNTVVDPCSGGGQSFYYKLDVATTFGRGAFTGRPNTDIGVSMPPMVGASTMMTTAVPTSSPQLGLSTIGASQVGTMTSNNTRYSSGNPCPTPAGTSIANAPTRSPVTGVCPVPSLRVWRELPRGQTRQ